MVPEFTNEPLSDFTQPAQAAAMQSALGTLRSEFDREWPLVIGGQQVTTGAWIDSFDPCHKRQRVGRVADLRLHEEIRVSAHPK